MIDTVALARARHPGAKVSLDALCTRYGIDRSHRTLHGALLDAELLAQVYVELTGGRQRGLLLAEDGQEGFSSVAYSRTGPRTPRLVTVSEAEREAHAAFVAKLKDPVWDLPAG